MSLFLFSILLLNPVDSKIEKVFSYLPEDAAVVLYAASPADVYEKMMRSSFGRMIADPKMAEFWGPTLLGDPAKMDQKLLEEIGLNLDQVKNLFKGPAAFSVSKLDFEGGAEPEMVMVFQVTGDSTNLQKVLDKGVGDPTDSESQIVLENQEFQGVEIHLRYTVTESGKDLNQVWALHKDMLILGPTLEAVQNAIGRGKGSLPSTLNSQAQFKKANVVLSEKDLFLYIPFGQIVKMIENQPAEEGKIPASVVTNLLGLSYIEGFVITMDFENAFTEAQLGVLYSENKGVVSLLTFTPKPVNQNRIIPQHAVFFNSSNFDMTLFWTRLENLVYSFNPNFQEMINQQINNMVASSGETRELAIRKNLLENLGDEWLSYTTVLAETGTEGPELGSVTIVNHKNAAQIEQGLDDLMVLVRGAINSFGALPVQVEKMPDMAQPTYRIAFAMDGENISESYLAVGEKYLVFAGPNIQVLTEALGQINQPGKSAWEKEGVQPVLREFTGKPVALGYGKLTAGLLNGFVKAMALTGEVDTSTLPDLKYLSGLFGPITYAVYSESNHLSLVLRVFNAP
ncbi:MAG: hypothetical protein H6510_11960 [Acidobacteria bacterium]|nr:hypothetical protein [Acidobacteriota bacterium]MCB9398521.1 hypothetical protein [Acidobacteriota bacterium]